MSFLIRFAMISVLLSCCCYLLASQAIAKDHVLTASKVNNDNVVNLTLGKAQIVDIEGMISDVMIADPSLVDVVALQSNRLYIVGSRLGDTNVIVLDAAGDLVRELDVHVRVDVGTIQRTLKDLFPRENIRVDTVNSQVILRGKVSTPLVASQIRDVASRFVSSATGDVSDASGLSRSIINMMAVQGEQQVMLQVRILELARTALKELGIESELNNGTPTLSDGDGVALNVGNQTGLTQSPFAVGQIFLNTGINGASPFEFLFNALEDRNLVKTLAEPNLTAISGQEAGFLAGGEFPLPSIPDNDIGASSEVTLEPFGVALNFVPTVLSNERISLQLSTEVSAISQENSISIGNPAIQIPGLDVRRANTTVEIASGATMMIAGLIQSDYIRGLSGIPGITDTPILGDLVKSRRFQRNETELVIMVTPYIVKPFSDQQKAKTLPKEAEDPLSISFLDNMRRIYGDHLPETPKVEKVGYVIE